MNQIESRAPGFFMAGHYRDGIALSDSIVSGDNAADRIGHFLFNRHISQKLHPPATA